MDKGDVAVGATPNLENANNRGFLWPPISDAVDTFLRRKHTGASSFERTWRLIHLWEAIEITLALAAMGFAARSPEQQDSLRRQRQFLHGRTWDPVLEAFNDTPAALAGNIDQWINILDHVAKSPDSNTGYLEALANFLNCECLRVEKLLNAWLKTCDVPAEYLRREEVDVRTAMRYVNTFRNRFAHVPFPYDPLTEICDALEDLTEQLFAISPAPASHEKDGRSSPLTGALQSESSFMHGSQIESTNLPVGNLSFVFPCKRSAPRDAWETGALVYVDPMMRPHILTRLKGQDACEYTRFKAEANSVVVISRELDEPLKTPDRSEFIQIDDAADNGEHDRSVTMSEALAAIRDADYDTGIRFFEGLLSEQPDYHVGWLRLGHAKREKAVRLVYKDRQQAASLLRESVADFEKAQQHIEQGYRAVAHYEKSKSLYRLAKMDPVDLASREAAIQEAALACELSDEERNYTWLDFLESYPPWKEATECAAPVA